MGGTRMLEASVKVLVYGAGVIGTLYAARLQDGGNRVTVVARGQRLGILPLRFGA